MNKAITQYKKRLSLARKSSIWYDTRKYYGQMVYVRFTHERGVFERDGSKCRVHNRCIGGGWYSLSLMRYE